MNTALVKAADILAAPPRLTRVLWCDNAGLTRAKSVSSHVLESTLKHGVGLSMGQQALPMMQDAVVPETGLSAVGEVRLIPDPATFSPDPGHEGVASVLGSMFTLAGEPWGHCPRHFAQRQVDALAALGYRVLASFENEFYLFRGEQPLDNSTYATMSAFGEAEAFADDLLAALDARELTPEMYYPESGPGQQELSIAPAEGIAAADRQVLYKLTVHQAARRHGLRASFTAKPVLDGAGNGCHIHISLWKDGQNAFYDPAHSLGLSSVAHQAIAGVLKHLPGLCALTVPSVNSYRRLLPDWWAGAHTCYGLDNREASLRVASTHLLTGSSGQSTNFELKTCDPSTNPYIALGGLLASIADGLRGQLDPGTALDVSPATLSDAERTQRHIVALPNTLGQALAHLQSDTVLQSALGPDLSRSYQAVRQAEEAFFAGGDDEKELAYHRFVY